MRSRIPHENWEIFVHDYYSVRPTCEGITLGMAFKATFEMGHDDPELSSRRPDHELADHIESNYVMPAANDGDELIWPVYEEAKGG